MNGLATRRALHEAIHGDVPNVPSAERRNSMLVGHRYGDDEDIPEPAFNPCAYGLGTPMEAARIRAIRRENRFLRVARMAIAIAIVGGVILAGNSFLNWHSAPATTHYQLRQAGVDVRDCHNDWHEGCLVCEHHLASGDLVKSTHC